MHRIPLKSDVHRNGPSRTERPYRSVNAFSGPLPRQPVPVQTRIRPVALSLTLRGRTNVWQYAYVPRRSAAATSHSMFPLGEWNQVTVAAAATAATINP